MDDAQLLSAYVQTRSADALAQLIERHIDFVYASALRQVRNPALAEDVTQAVFIIFTRKTASIRPTSLTGWLFNTTRHCAANARRAELRRRHHERQAAKPEVQMQPESYSTAGLDHALSQLRSSDRQVVLLRYLQQREFADVSSILGISEQTARQRLSRAIERLRNLLSVGGQSLPSAAIIQTLSSAITPAPTHLSAIAAAAASNITTTGTAAALATKTIHVMNWIKLKIAATLLLAAVVAGTSSIAVVKAISPQADTTANPAPPTVPVAAPAAGMPAAGAVATFSDGMRVELIGVAPSPIEGQQWWRPDGSPLPQPLYRSNPNQITGPPGYKPYEFALKINGTDPTWDTTASTEASMASAFSFLDPHELGLFAAVPANPVATINFACATGPWQTRAAVPANAVFETGVVLNGVSFTPGDDKKNLSITLEADHASMNALFTGDSRILALDLKGKTHTTYSRTDTAYLLKETKTVSFLGLSRDQIKEFQIRSRPFNHTVKFQNISLVPGQLTAPTVEQHEIGAFTATFATGGSAEVVGISNWPPAKNWWRPDGSPLQQIPPDYGPYTGPTPNDNEQAYAVAIKLTNPHDNPSWFWTFPGSHGVAVPSTTRPVPAGSPDVYRVILPVADKTTDFRVGLATGPWYTWANLILGDGPASISVGNTQISFSAPQEKNGGVLITTVDNLRIDELRDVQRQLVAIDKSGIAHTAYVQESEGVAAKYSFLIPQVTKAQIKSYQFQTRQYEYINFRNLPLKPTQHTEVTIEPDTAPSPTAPPKPPGEEGL